jgi:hypothetical protein
MEGLKDPGKHLVFESVMGCPAGCQFGNGQLIAKFVFRAASVMLNEVDLPEAGLLLLALRMAHDRDAVLEVLGGKPCDSGSLDAQLLLGHTQQVVHRGGADV